MSKYEWIGWRRFLPGTFTLLKAHEWRLAITDVHNGIRWWIRS